MEENDIMRFAVEYVLKNPYSKNNPHTPKTMNQSLVHFRDFMGNEELTWDFIVQHKEKKIPFLDIFIDMIIIGLGAPNIFEHSSKKAFYQMCNDLHIKHVIADADADADAEYEYNTDEMEMESEDIEDYEYI